MSAGCVNNQLFATMFPCPRVANKEIETACERNLNKMKIGIVLLFCHQWNSAAHADYIRGKWGWAVVVAWAGELGLGAAGPLWHLEEPPWQSRSLAGVMDLQIQSNKDI